MESAFVPSLQWGGRRVTGVVNKSSRCGMRWSMNAHRRIALPGGRDYGSEAEVVAGAAIQPLRRPAQTKKEQEYNMERQEPDYGAEGQVERTFGFWDAVPIIALVAAVGGLGYLGGKRFIQNQKNLVVQYGEDLVLYGSTFDQMREITKTYKKKLGPGMRRPEMFKSYLQELFTTGAISIEAIEKVKQCQGLLKISGKKAAQCFNEVGLQVRSQPSVLGKVLFVAERMLDQSAMEALEVRKMFRYGSATVDELQKSVLDFAYREACERAIDEEDATVAPAREADVLRLSQSEADVIFNSVVRERNKLAEEAAAKELEKLQKAAQIANEVPVDEPEPVAEQATVHAYQCTECGYTLFPAAGREFKFFGSDFACPQCGAPKDKFIDLNEESGDE